MWELKSDNIAPEIAKKICCVYDQGDITDQGVWKQFSKFVHWDMDPD